MLSCVYLARWQTAGWNLAKLRGSMRLYVFYKRTQCRAYRISGSGARKVNVPVPRTRVKNVYLARRQTVRPIRVKLCRSTRLYTFYKCCEFHVNRMNTVSARKVNVPVPRSRLKHVYLARRQTTQAIRTKLPGSTRLY